MKVTCSVCGWSREAKRRGPVLMLLDHWKDMHTTRLEEAWESQR